MKHKITGNCPYCDSERGITTPWGMSSEGMINLKARHDDNHPENISQAEIDAYSKGLAQGKLEMLNEEDYKCGVGCKELLKKQQAELVKIWSETFSTGVTLIAKDGTQETYVKISKEDFRKVSESLVQMKNEIINEDDSVNPRDYKERVKCNCRSKQGNEIVKIFENVYGDFLSVIWFERTPLEKERELEEFTKQLNKWIAFDGFE